MYNKFSKTGYENVDLTKVLDELGRELGVTTEELSEILPKYSESYKSSIWNMEKYIEDTDNALGGILESFNKYNEQFKADAEKTAQDNEYINAWNKQQESMAQPQTNPDVYDHMGKQFGRIKWKYEEIQKVQNDETLSDGEKYGKIESINKIYKDNKEADRKEQLVQMGQEMEEIVEDSLQEIILDFDNFDKSMKNMSKKLMSYLLEQFTSMMFQNLNEKVAETEWFGKIVEKSDQGGFLGGIASIFTGIFGKRHSGGVIPNSGYSLGGTSEQLAILKGGERVLSPGENVEYERNAGASPVVFNNFNVKAWDSKDVQKYLLENKNLLNAITFEGIKYNNQQLRSIVRNA